MSIYQDSVIANSQFQNQSPSSDPINPSQQSISRRLTIPYPEFQQQYTSSLTLLNSVTQEKIQRWTWNRETQNYLYFIQPEKFVQFSKNQRLSHFQEHNSQLITHYLLEAMKQRQDKVQIAIMNDILKIGQRISNQQKHTITKPQTQQRNPPSLQRLSPEQQKAYYEELKNRHRQVVLQHKKQRIRLQKLKQQEQLKKQQIQRQKLTQSEKQKEQMKKVHSQIIAKKIQQQKQKREKQIKLHEQRNKDYQFIVKSWASSVLLHQKMEKEFRKRYEAMFEEERNKIKTERTRLSLNARIEDLNLRDHETNYLTKRSQRQAVRAAKLEQQQRTVEAHEKQLKKYKRYKRPNEDGENTDEENNQDQQEQGQQNGTKYSSINQNSKTYRQLQQQKRLKAMQRRKKMQEYWETFVKQQKQPKIDPKKQQQLKEIIESLQNARRKRKVKNQKGEYVYEELKLCDPTLKGMEYLEHARELGRLRKSSKRKDSLGDESSVHEQNQRKKRSIDYLKQLRQSRSSSLNAQGQGSINQKLSFLDKKDMSFHEKLQRVDRETFKLQQLTKNSENQLKYGKFKTSEQILQYKEDIDNNHLQILRMKIKLAANGRQG